MPQPEEVSEPEPPRAQPTELVISDEELALFPSLGLDESDGDARATPALDEQPEAPRPSPSLEAEHEQPRPSTETQPVTPSPIVAVSAIVPEIPADASPEDRLAAAAVALQGAEMRDDIADTLLEFCAPYLTRRMLLVVRGDTVIGWRGEGDGVDETAIRAISIPLGEPSVFLGLTQGQSFWLASLPPMPHNLGISLALGGEPSPECLILPVVLRSKSVCFLYGDNRTEPARSAPIGHLRRLVQMAGLAFQVYLLKSKMRRV